MPLVRVLTDAADKAILFVMRLVGLAMKRDRRRRCSAFQGCLESMQSPEKINPCIARGACCVYCRASFYWAEADNTSGGTVPVELTEKLNDFRCVMRGANQKSPRCAALPGEIGKSVWCSICDLHSSVCRDFDVSWLHGICNERCDQAGQAWVLEPLARAA